MYSSDHGSFDSKEWDVGRFILVLNVGVGNGGELVIGLLGLAQVFLLV